LKSRILKVRSLLKHLEKLLDIIDMHMNSLPDRFASKQTTNERIFKLKSQLKSLFELMLASGVIRLDDNSDDDGDKAMLSKKPLGGNFCGSCERDIKNLNPNAGHHLPWKKLPARDPTDRLPMSGQGFSKMLQQVHLKDESY